MERRDALTPAVFHILLALAPGERHGYAVMRQVEASPRGGIRMGPGTLYGSIKRMLRDGLIRESGERVDPPVSDERRRYYELTPKGRRVLQAETDRLAELVTLARREGIRSRGTSLRPRTHP